MADQNKTKQELILFGMVHFVSWFFHVFHRFSMKHQVHSFTCPQSRSSLLLHGNTRQKESLRLLVLSALSIKVHRSLFPKRNKTKQKKLKLNFVFLKVPFCYIYQLIHGFATEQFNTSKCVTQPLTSHSFLIL